MVVKQITWRSMVIHVAKINYITSGHLEKHLFTRNKHTCTKHPTVANIRFHFIFYTP